MHFTKTLYALTVSAQFFDGEIINSLFISRRSFKDNISISNIVLPEPKNSLWNKDEAWKYFSNYQNWDRAINFSKAKSIVKECLKDKVAPELPKFDNSKCNISESKLSKIIMMLSSDDDEFKKHSQLIYESFGLQLSNSYSSYGLATYDFNDIDKLAKTFTYGNKPLYDSDITAIKQIAKTLAYKN